jgi:hypothetical protein
MYGGGGQRSPLAFFRRRVIPCLVWSEPDLQEWKDPPRLGYVAVRVAPAILDLWRAGVLSAAGFSQAASASTDFHTGQRSAKERAIRTPGIDDTRRTTQIGS